VYVKPKTLSEKKQNGGGSTGTLGKIRENRQGSEKKAAKENAIG